MHRNDLNVALRPARASRFVTFGCDSAALRFVRGLRRRRGFRQPWKETRPLAAHGMQCSLDALGIARDDGEVGFSRLVGLRAALFPIP